MRTSVVTPSFNMGRYLEDTITSVLANLRDGDEYFIIDGGSTDGSVDIIERYKDRITGWVSEPDKGYAEAIAKGFARASGDILCWINAGDLYLAGAFEAACRLFEPGTEFIFGDDFYVNEDNKILAFSRGWVPSLRTAMLYGGWTPLQDACFWRRELYRKVGGIDAGLQYAADYDLFLRMALASHARYVPVTFSAFRRHDGQKSISSSAAYERERRHARIREVKGVRSGALLTTLYSGANRIAMSARSRLAPLAWRRPDLVGVSVTSLPCGGYWPAGNQL